MVKDRLQNIAQASVLCLASAFASVAQAEEQSDTYILDNATHEMMVNHPSCILASDTLSPDGLILTEDQKVLSDLAVAVHETTIGQVIVQGNANDGVLYCLIADNSDMHGTYNNSTSIVNINPAADNVDLLNTAAEEFSHAYQYGEGAVIDYSFDEYSPHSVFNISMAMEAQAKIWKNLITFEAKGRLEPNSSDTPTDIKMRDCVHSENITGCTQEAFESFFTVDNVYTEEIYKSISGVVMSLKEEGEYNSANHSYDVCPDLFTRSFGVIPTSDGDIQFLPDNYNIDIVVNEIRADGVTPENIKSAMYPMHLFLDNIDNTELSPEERIDFYRNGPTNSDTQQNCAPGLGP